LFPIHNRVNARTYLSLSELNAYGKVNRQNDIINFGVASWNSSTPVVAQIKLDLYH